MCGHVGIAGKLEHKDEAVFKRMLMYDYFRGPDSTGMVSFKDTDKTFRTAKIASHPLDLFEMKRFTEALSYYTSSVFLGHNRAATRGVVNNANAHPFTCDHISGAHNGTLTVSSYNDLQDAIGEKTGTDSEAIFIAIARLGIDETVKLLQGAWALVWIDKNEGTLNFLRNDQRPFWFGYSDKLNKVYWASEFWMITAALQSSSSPLFKNEKGHSYFQTLPDWHYKLGLDELKAGGTERPKPRVKELKGREPAPVTPVGQSNFPSSSHGTSGTTHSSNRTGGTATHSTTTALTTGTVPARGKDGDEFIPERVTVEWDANDPAAGTMNKDQLDFLTKYGCSWCYSDIDTAKPGLTIFPSEGRVLCPKCTGSDHNRIYLPAYEMQMLQKAKAA